MEINMNSVKAHSFLKKISGSDAGRIYPLFSTLSTIGRSFTNTVCIPEPFLSRKHCSIRYEEPRWIISDYGGLNGTYLNGIRMESSSFRILSDKTIVFLGDPQESTCGFIFLTSLPVIPDPAEEGISSTSVVPASVPGCSSSSLDLPSSSTHSTPDLPPEQSDDVSSTRTVLSFGGMREKPRTLATLDSTPPEIRAKFRERMERLKEIMLRKRSQVSASPLNDRKLPILYDASSTSPRSTLRSNINLNSRYPSISPYTTVSTAPAVRRICSSEGPSQTVPVTNGSEQSRDSPTAQITSADVAGSSRRSAPEFDVLDMLADSVDSDDSDCSVSSMDSLRTRIRKQKDRANRAKEGNQLPSVSPSKGSSSSSDKVKVIDLRIKGLEESTSEQDSLNFQDSESLICDIEDGVQDCVNKLGDEDWMSTSKPDESDTLQYLKERVLKLQKNVMDATEELKNALEKNKEQQSVIEALQSTQGVSTEQLSEDLEAELSCNICTELLIKPVILDCGHVFCQYCIGVWKKKKKQCPNCRDAIRSECEVRVLDSYISKVIDRLDPLYRIKRFELIEARKTEKVHKSKKSGRKSARSSPYVVPASNISAELIPRTGSALRDTVRIRHMSRRMTPLLRNLMDRIESRREGTN